jgi:predicted O-methyltransferase YrrM
LVGLVFLKVYILVRILKPTYVVETGVAAGVSSAYILMGLEMNNKGELFSIDLPNYELEYFPKLGLKPVSIIPKERNVGFAIPPWLKHRWHLILGNSREILPKLLNELKTIDIFLHDSEHTYDHMMFEYREAWSHLKSGGLLLSDNVFMNRAFEDFAKEVKAKPILLYFAGWGAIVKQ